MNVTALSDAKVGSAGVVDRVDLPDEVSHYLAHLGFLPGASVEILRHETARHIFLKLNLVAGGLA
jgi:Fe2+ transport system protein FeoA